MKYQIINADCIEAMRAMPDNSVDSIVTDPPYELGFMGKAWDASGIANNPAMWAEALRVLKPGGHLLAFSGSRTYHRMTCAIEDAGFEIRDQIMWVYGSGFPKSLDVSKAIDKAAGAEGTYGEKKANVHSRGEHKLDEGWRRPWMDDPAAVDKSGREYLPATDAARQWEGWGTALKPAHEPICVARKPLVGTVAANVLSFGTGALNIDGCRVEGAPRNPGFKAPDSAGIWGGKDNTNLVGYVSPEGRWPANIIHDGSDEVVALFPESNGSGAARTLKRGTREGEGWGMADEVGQLRDAGTGSAARFFYCAKASKTDRDAGLGEFVPLRAGIGDDRPSGSSWERRAPEKNPNAPRANIHPTVKPTDLMAYLVRLVTPPGGLVLDPFMGSGSTGKACMREGMRFIGCELSPEYAAIAEARIIHEMNKGKSDSASTFCSHQMGLFEAAP